MRMFVLKSASILSAFAVAMGAVACGRAPDQDLAVVGSQAKPVKVASADEGVAAKNRAAAAEARARAAEAKVQCERDRQAASNRGAVVGGIAGAVVGGQVAGDGAKSEGPWRRSGRSCWIADRQERSPLLTLAANC